MKDLEHELLKYKNRYGWSDEGVLYHLTNFLRFRGLGDAALDHLFQAAASEREPPSERKCALLDRIRKDPFTNAYVTALLWSEMDNADPETGGDPVDANFCDEDLTEKSLEEILKDCEEFQRDNAEALQVYYDGLNYGPDQAGHDFALTRNRHGAGFWDRYYGDDKELYTVCHETLTEAAHAVGEIHIGVGEGKLYYE